MGPKKLKHTPFMEFMKVRRRQLERQGQQFPGGWRDVSMAINGEWTSMTDFEKQIWIDRAEEGKAREAGIVSSWGRGWPTEEPATPTFGRVVKLPLVKREPSPPPNVKVRIHGGRLGEGRGRPEDWVDVAQFYEPPRSGDWIDPRDPDPTAAFHSAAPATNDNLDNEGWGFPLNFSSTPTIKAECDDGWGISHHLSPKTRTERNKKTGFNPQLKAHRQQQQEDRKGWEPQLDLFYESPPQAEEFWDRMHRRETARPSVIQKGPPSSTQRVKRARAEDFFQENNTAGELGIKQEKVAKVEPKDEPESETSGSEDSETESSESEQEEEDVKPNVEHLVETKPNQVLETLENKHSATEVDVKRDEQELNLDEYFMSPSASVVPKVEVKTEPGVDLEKESNKLPDAVAAQEEENDVKPDLLDLERDLQQYFY